MKCRIAAWRESLQGRAGISESDVDELELHLRQGIEKLISRDLEHDEAFLIASRRIGQPHELEHEYAISKPVSAWKTRISWMISGILKFWILTGVVPLTTNVMLLASGIGNIDRYYVDKPLLILEFNNSGYTWGFAGIALQVFCIMLLCLWFLKRSRLASQNRKQSSSRGQFARLAALGIGLRLLASVGGAAAIFNYGSHFLGQFKFVTQLSAETLTVIAVLGFAFWLNRQWRRDEIRRGNHSPGAWN